jgi:hypothetical protein
MMRSLKPVFYFLLITHSLVLLWEGYKLLGGEGFPARRLLVDGEKWLGERGSGQFLRRRPFGEVL